MKSSSDAQQAWGIYEMEQLQGAGNVNGLLTDLKSCSKRRDIEQGRKVHAKAVHSQNDKNIYVLTALINMYAKCGSMADARDVFDSLQKPDVVSWTALLLGYANNGDGLAALEMFSRMKARGCGPDSVTYIAALKACTSLSGNCLELGREIHSQVGCHLNHFVLNTLIDMYAKCGSMIEACIVFDSILKPDVVSWNALLLGYANNGDGLVALEMFSRMKACGCMPDSVTYIACLKACTTLEVDEDGLGRGRKIHSHIPGCHLVNRFVQNTLIDMYAKCGSMVEAREIFDKIKKPDVVSWNALILGYADNEEGLVALEMLSWMKADACEADPVTYIAALKACGLVGALAAGRKFHKEISETVQVDANLVTCLVDFYAKCGSTVEAREVFDLYSEKRDASTWTALLAGYGSLGHSEYVFDLFQAMQDEGYPPDSITFLFLLLCCSHAGLVEKARQYFKDMPLKYGTTPSVVHYTCMVDVLGRANQLNEATGMIRKMPCNPNAFTWTTLLAACRKWKNINVGNSAFQSLVYINKKQVSAYLVMAQIYGSVGMWEEQERVLEMRKQVGAWKPAVQAYLMDEMQIKRVIH